MSPSTYTVQLAPRLTGFVLALVGAVFLTVSCITIVMTQGFVSRAQHSEATVVSLYAGTSHPTLEFTDSKGEKFEFHGTGWTSHRMGDRVPVLFLESDPVTSVKIDEPGSLWFLPAMFGLLGGSALLIGLFAILRRKGKSET